MVHDDDSSDDVVTVPCADKTQQMADSLLPDMANIPPFVDGLDEPDTDIVDRPLRYERKKLLGKGGGGVVISVFDRKMRRPVALKLANSTESERAARLRFLREAQVTGQLSHPNVMPVYDIGTDTDGEVFFTMKEVDGESLSELIREGRAGSLVERLLIFRQVCNAIAFAHSRSVLHRDIKPANIMIGEYGEVLVVDWGLCKVIGEEEESQASFQGVDVDDSLRTQDGLVAGTPAYMAPEQARGFTDQLCEQTDIYSLGAVLYTLLTDQAPFFGKVDTVLEKVIQGDFEPPRSRASAIVPKELDAIVCKAMSTSFHERYESVRALSEDVQAFMESRPVSVVQYNAAQRAMKWAVRNQKVVRPVGLTSALGLVALFSGGLLHINQMEQVMENALAEAHRANQAERAALVEAVNGRAALATAEAQTGRAGLAAKQLAEIRKEMVALDTDTVRADVGLSVLSKTALLSHAVLQSEENILDAEYSPDGTQFAYLTANALNLVDAKTGETAEQFPLPEQVFEEMGMWLDGVPWVLGHEERTLVGQHVPTQQRRVWTAPEDACSPKQVHYLSGHLLTHCSRLGLITWAWDSEKAIRFDRFDDVQMDILRASTDGQRLLVKRYKTDFSMQKATPAVLERGRVLWEDSTRSTLVSISPDGRYVLGDAPMGFYLHNLKTGHAMPFHSDHSGAFLWSPDSSAFQVILHNGDRRSHHIGEAEGVLKPSPSLALFRTITSMVRSQEGNQFAFWYGKGVQLFTEKTVDPPLLDLELYDRKQGTTEATLSADGRLIAIGTESGRIVVIDSETGHILWNFHTPELPVRGLSFGVQSDTLVSGHWDGAARVWDLTTGEVLRKYHPAKYTSAGGPPKITEVLVIDERRVLLAGGDGHIGVWSLDDGRLITDFSGAVRYVWDSGYSEATDKVYVSNRMGSTDGRLGAVLDLKTGAIDLVPGKRSAFGVTVSPNGERWIINNDGPASVVVDHNGNVMRELPIATTPGVSGSWSADGRLVVLSDWSGEYQIWTTNNWESVGSWSDGAITSSVLFAPDKRLLYVISFSGQLRTLSLVGPDAKAKPGPEWLIAARLALLAGNREEAKAAAASASDQDPLAKVWLGALSNEGPTTSDI